jgi:hypothetical protein
MWSRFVDDGLPADGVRTLTESIQRLGLLAERVVEVTLRRALRQKATEFFVEQAARLEVEDVLGDDHPLRSSIAAT